MDYELDDETAAALKVHTDTGGLLTVQGKHTEALEEYFKALDLIPEPQEDWEAAALIMASIGGIFYSMHDFRKAKDAFEDAVRCEGGLGNPFIHLRLGEIYFELGDLKRAGDELSQAFSGGGSEIFKDEPAKYAAYLVTLVGPLNDVE